MREHVELSALKADIAQQPVSLLFVKTANCGVCEATFEKTRELLESYPQVELLVASMEKIPSLAGEFLVLTAPTILLFMEGKEVFRQSRIAVFRELERVVQLSVESL